MLAACSGPGTGAGTDRTATPLTNTPGDAARGRALFLAREGGHCVLCHAVPDAAAAGNVGPSLAGVAARLDAAQLRYRVEDITRVNPAAAMPAFHRSADLNRVAPERRGRTLLTDQELEDVVAYLGTLQ